MREKLKQFYIVLLVFILTIMGQYGHVLQTEAVFSTQKETVSAKSQTGKRLTEQKSEEKVYASGIPTGIEISYIQRDLITVIFYYQISLKPLKTLSLSQVSFPLDFPLCYIFPYGFTNSDKGKYKGKKIL